MQQAEILTKVQDVVIECLGSERNEIVMDARFMADLGCDSIMLAEIVMKLEDEFGLRITDEEAGGIRTVGNAVMFIESKVMKAA